MDELRSEMKVIRNYRCTKDFSVSSKNHKIIEECAKNVDNVKIHKVLGVGTYGTVYLAEAMVPDIRGRFYPIDVAVKRIEVDTKHENVDELFYEVEYTHFMAESGLGPKVYDAFYVKLSSRKIVQYIFMEPGDGSISDLLESDDSVETLTKSVEEMINLLHDQIFVYHMYCLDQKPGNFIYTKRKRSIDVKMIDFGKDFCNLRKIPPIYEFLFPDPKTQMNMLFIVLLIQLYVVIYNYMDRSMKETCDILSPFYEEPVFEWALTHPKDIEGILESILYKDPRGAGYVLKHYIANKKSDSSRKIAKDTIELISNCYYI